MHKPYILSIDKKIYCCFSVKENKRVKYLLRNIYFYMVEYVMVVVGCRPIRNSRGLNIYSTNTCTLPLPLIPIPQEFFQQQGNKRN
jgi:hypothetical protein